MEKPKIKTNSEDYVLYSPNAFHTMSKKDFREKNTYGYVPYYFDKKDYTLKEIKLDRNFNPLKENGRPFYNNETNPFGFIFFLKEDGFEVINRVSSKIGEMIEAIDKQKKLYLKYPAALVDELSKRKNKKDDSED